jgi:hypothetical protein
MFEVKRIFSAPSEDAIRSRTLGRRTSRGAQC